MLKKRMIPLNYEILSPWKNYFEGLLNTHSEEISAPVTFYTVDLRAEEATIEEVKSVTKRFKSNKAPGIDNKASECLKYRGETLYQHFHQLIITI